MKQQVINYECDITHREEEFTDSYYRVYDPHSYRYGLWGLNDIIDQFARTSDYLIRWIGCDPNAHILSFFYCILVGCLQDSEGDQLFIKLKYSLYQQSKQVLTIAEQKIFIQHLGLIQDSKSIGEFLKRSNHLQPIFMKIFNKRMQTFPLKHMQYKGQNKIQQLQKYSTIFSFVYYKILNEKCANLTINNITFLIVEQKQCYFVIQKYPNREFKKNKSNKNQFNQNNQNYIQYFNNYQSSQNNLDNRINFNHHCLNQNFITNQVYTNKIIHDVNKPIKQRFQNCHSLYCIPNQLYSQVKKMHIISKKQQQQTQKIDKNISTYMNKQQKLKTNLVSDKTIKVENNPNFCVRTTVKCQKNKNNFCSGSSIINKQRSLSDQFINSHWQNIDEGGQHSFGKIQCKKCTKENTLSFKDNGSEKIQYQSLKSNRTFHEANPKQKKKLYYNFPHFLRQKGENNSQITFRPSPHSSYSPKSLSINRSNISSKKCQKKKNIQIQSHKLLPQTNSNICQIKNQNFNQKC